MVVGATSTCSLVALMKKLRRIPVVPTDESTRGEDDGGVAGRCGVVGETPSVGDWVSGVWIMWVHIVRQQWSFHSPSRGAIARGACGTRRIPHPALRSSRHPACRFWVRGLSKTGGTYCVCSTVVGVSWNKLSPVWGHVGMSRHSFALLRPGSPLPFSFLFSSSHWRLSLFTSVCC